MKSSSPERALYPIAYAIALLLVVLPLLEFTLTIWPLRPNGLMWRFGTFGLLTQALMLPTFGIFVAIIASATLLHRRILLTLAVIAGLFVIVYSAGLVLFVLDGLQARATARPELRQTVGVTTIRAVAAATLYIFIWGWMSLAAFRSGRSARAVAPARQTSYDVLYHTDKEAVP
jgi:hypothetical protein